MRVLSNKLKAFTLAEVIVALAVVGVVAALTIPNISRNMQAAHAKTAFKKALNEVNQALAEFTMDEGRNLAQTTSADVSTGSIQAIFIDPKYLAGKKVPDGTNNTNNNRWNILTNLTPTYSDNGSISAGSSINTTASLSSNYNYYILPDNIAFITSDDMYGCGDPHLARANNGTYAATANNGCLAYIDINGPKGPNTVLMGTKAGGPDADACQNVVPPNGDYMIKRPTGNNGTYCDLKDESITDVFPVVFFNDRVYPATVAGYWVLNDLIGQTITEASAD